MARWPKLDARQTGEAQRFALRTIAGTLVPGDFPLVGRSALVGAVEDHGMAVSQAYAAVNTMCAQPWMQNAFYNGVPVPMVSSVNNYLNELRPAAIAATRAAHDWSDYGKQGGRPRKA